MEALATEDMDTVGATDGGTADGTEGLALEVSPPKARQGTHQQLKARISSARLASNSRQRISSSRLASAAQGSHRQLKARVRSS
ncbi:hypothetical protein RI054_08g42740 [Pseudoscourfieldia marina]